MKQFRIKMTKYTEQGALTNEVTTTYFDNEENAKNSYYEYNAMRYESTNNKMYKMEFSTLAYKKITEVDDFFNIFEA